MNAPATNALQADQVAIEAFLRESVGSSFHLVAITPDGPVSAYHFGGDAEKAAEWARAENARGRGLYWTVNRVRDGYHGKPEKRDITSARFAHVDIDPPKDGSPFDKGAVIERLGALRCEPSFVVDTGGGLAAFWRLDDVAANLPAIEDINAGIADAFEADRCHNIDRLMRLPGTINWPNKKKAAAGRGPAASRVVVDDQGTVHEPMALAIEFPRRPRPERDAATVEGPYALLTADDLGLDTFHPLRSLIDRPAGRDRSTDALACAGKMVRDGFSNDQILGVLMNPANAVHAHIGDQRDPRYQALRCIEVARASESTKMTRTLRRDDFGADAGLIAEEEARVAAARGPMPLIDPAIWHGQDAPPREWALKDWIPLRQATLLTGNGGVGKSLLAQMMCTCSALGLPLLGQEMRPAPSIYLTCEDDDEELWRRQSAICASLGVPLSALSGKLFLAALTGQQGNALANADGNGRLVMSDRWHSLLATVESIHAGFIALDNASHLLTGHNAHNDVGAVATFLGMLSGLAISSGGAVLVLHHPNKAGDDWLGSVAWENQVRSRIIMKPSEIEGDSDARSLQNPKANYAPSGGRIDFRWHRGAFTRDEDVPANMGDELRENIMASADNEAFLKCLRQRNSEQRAVSERRSPSFAPSVFLHMPESRGVTKKRLEAAMDRLFRLGKIERAQLWNGPDRKPVFGLRETAGNGAGDTVRETRGTVAKPLNSFAGNAGETHTVSKDIPGGASAAGAPGHGEDRVDLSRVRFPAAEVEEVRQLLAEPSDEWEGDE